MWTYIGTIADDHFFVTYPSDTDKRQIYLRSSHGGCGANGAIGYCNLSKSIGRNDPAVLLSSVGPEFEKKQERFDDRTHYEILKSKRPHLVSILHESERPTTSFNVVLKPPDGKQLPRDIIDGLSKLDYLTKELYKIPRGIPVRLQKRVEREVREWTQAYKINVGSMKDFEDVTIIRKFLRNRVLPSIGSKALEKVSIVGGTIEMQDVIIGTLRSFPSTKDSLIRYTPGPAIYYLEKIPSTYMTIKEFIRKILPKVDILQLNKPERYHLMGGRSRAVYELLSRKVLHNGRLKIALCTTRGSVSAYYQKFSDLALKVLDAIGMGIGYAHNFLHQRKGRGDIYISAHRPNLEEIERIRKKVDNNRIEKGEINGIKRTDFPVPEPIKRVSPVGAGDAFGCGVDFALNPEL